MAFLDYSPVELTDPTRGARRLGDALTDVMKRREQRRQHEENLRFQREQEDRKFRQAEMNAAYQNRIIDQREKREQLDFNRRQNIDNAAIADRARKAASPQEAEAILATARTYDPVTGKEIGRGKLTAGPMQDVGPQPTEPTQPEMPKEVPEALSGMFQAVPGMTGLSRAFAPPEVAARQRGMAKREAPALFVDRIDESGAVLVDREGNVTRSPVKAGWKEGVWIDASGAPIQPPHEVGDMESRRAKLAAGDDGGPIALGGPSSLGDVQVVQRDIEAYSEDMSPPAGPAAMERFQREQQEFQREKAAFPGQLQEFQARAKRAEATRPYTASFGPDDPGITFDFETQRNAGRNDAAERFLASLPDAMSDRDRAAAAQIHAGIKSGTIDPTKAGSLFQKERLQTQGEVFRAGEGAANRQTRIEVAQIGSRKPGLVLQERRFQASQDKDIRKETRKDIQDWLKASGLETAPKQLASMDESVRQLDGNAREQQAALVGMARAVQGDNRFSDADYRVFVEKGGVGTLDQAANTISRMIDGEFGEETVRVAKQMAKALRAVYDQRLHDAAKDGREEFVHNEIYDPQVAESVLEQRLGKNYFVRESSRGGPRGGPPELNARMKGKSGSSKTIKVTGSAVDDILKREETR